MGKYILKKTARLIIVLFGVSILTFVFTSWIQGNPAEIVLSQTGIDPTKEEIAALTEEMGLNENIVTQYVNWVSKAVRLDFGNSYITETPVTEELLYRLPSTLGLTVGAFVLMVVLSVTFGIIAVVKRNTFIDHIIEGVTFIFMGVPGFVLGLLLAYVFSVHFKVLPMVGPKTLSRFILPVMTLALPMACRYIRMIKSNMIEVLDEDYIFLLRTKGIRERVIMFSNALKNALIPIVNLMGISLGSLLGGSVIIENIFSWPGLGSFLMTSINNRDYPVVLAYVLFMAVIFVVINYVVDIIVSLLDPRVQLREGEGL